MIYIGGKLPHRFECSKRLQPCVKRLQGNSKRSHTQSPGKTEDIAWLKPRSPIVSREHLQETMFFPLPCVKSSVQVWDDGFQHISTSTSWTSGEINVTNFRYRNKTHTSCIKNGDMSSTKTRACLKMLGSPHHILDVLLNLIVFYIAQWSENGINWGSEIWWFTKNIGVFDQRSSTQMSICHGQNVGWMWCRVMHPTMGIQTWTTIPQSSASYLSCYSYNHHLLLCSPLPARSYKTMDFFSSKNVKKM